MSALENALIVYATQAVSAVPGLTTSNLGPEPEIEINFENLPHLQFSGFTMRVREKSEFWQQEFQEMSVLCILTDKIDEVGKNLAMIDVFDDIDQQLRVNRTLTDNVKWAHVSGYTIVDNPVLQARTQSMFWELVFELVA